MLKLAEQDDFAEDLYLTIRELMERFDVSPGRIRRMVNDAIRGEPRSRDLRERVLPSGFATEAEREAAGGSAH